MLGYNVEFGHIHAVKLAQSAKGLWDKRIGYLACSLFLHETHELSIMLINTLQKDLKSNNYLEVCAALTALCHLLNKDMIPAEFGLVEEALSHPKDIVRKKAVMVFSRLFHDAPDTMIHLDEKFRQMLTERDPSVLGSILYLVPSLISILEQVLDRWLPRSYDYHGVPAPWIQIKIIENMGLLARDDEKISSEVGPFIVHTLRKAENGVDAAYAIIFECISAISRLHPQTLSIIIHKFPNLNPLNTLDLLYAMVNSQNVVVVMEHMINALRTISTTDEFSRLLLVNRIVAGDLLDDKAVDSTFLIISKSIESKEKSEEIQSDINNTTKNLTSWALRILGEFAQIITTLLKCVSKMKYCPDNIIECVAKCCQSSSGDVKQRSREFIILSKDFELLDKIIKPYENFDDFTVRIFNIFYDVDKAKPYNRIPITREDTNSATEIRYEAYEKPNMAHYSKQIMTSLPTYDDARLSESDRDILLPNDRNNQSSRGIGPPVTPVENSCFCTDGFMKLRSIYTLTILIFASNTNHVIYLKYKLQCQPLRLYNRSTM
ncbi:armadillo-type protein [Gigaspora rosea]|uniref:Armadillo-type protein n=1 Tax=Gigaspora rosea TaxID=44941 RepID=A0A397UYR2_9GLOM|nr:armadillo-type protein [Gigaspora rosea]